VPNSQGFPECVRFVLEFQLWPSIAVNLWIQRIFRALIFQLSFQRLASSISWCWLFQQSCDSDTATLLEKLGCNVATVASRFESLSALGQTASSFQILLFEYSEAWDGWIWSRNENLEVKKSCFAIDHCHDSNLWWWCVGLMLADWNQYHSETSCSKRNFLCALKSPGKQVVWWTICQKTVVASTFSEQSGGRKWITGHHLTSQTPTNLLA